MAYRFSGLFISFLKEAQFIHYMIISGVTQLRNANYASQGVYFQSFTSLTTAFERLGKLCIIVDHYLENSGTLPDIRMMKTEIGHNISLLITKATEIKTKRNYVFDFQNEISDEIYNRILKVLSNFAEGDRYSNINYIIGYNSSSDPIAQWFREVDMYIYDHYISNRMKRNIENRANFISSITEDVSHVCHLSEENENIDTVLSGSIKTGIFNAVAPYRQLFVLQLFRYLCELIVSLQHDSMKNNDENLPYFSELFAFTYNDDDFLKRNKKWN